MARAKPKVERADSHALGVAAVATVKTRRAAPVLVLALAAMAWELLFAENCDSFHLSVYSIPLRFGERSQDLHSARTRKRFRAFRFLAPLQLLPQSPRVTS